MGPARGFTLVELLLVVAIIGILAAIAIPNLLAARIRANESSAIGSMRAVVSSQADYNNAHRGFADDLAALAATCPGMTVAFIAGDLAANGVTKSGYTFSLAPGAGAAAGPADCNGVVTRTTYYATATPTSVGITGYRAFAANASSAIWQDTSGVPPSEPFTPSATISPLAQ